MISNCHNVGKTEESDKVSILSLYNNFSKGVDKNNHLCQTYRNPHSIIKWWKRIFFLMLELVISNSYIIYKHKGEKLDHKEFNLSIVNSLICD